MIILPSVSCGIISRSGSISVVTEASTYIAAVEAADGQSLESSVKTAINNFIDGCKSDGIWDAIKSCCILAGARTLNGALVPLKGTAPTSFFFTSSDYSRSTGLLSDGTTKYLNSNRAHNADPQDSFHLSVYHHSSTIPQNGTSRYLIGARSVTSAVCFSVVGLYKATTSGAIGVTAGARSIIESSPATPNNTSSHSAGIYGVTRNSASQYIAYFPPTFNGTSTSTVTNQPSKPRDAVNYLVFGLANTNTNLSSAVTARIAFYSIGEYLNMTLLKSRVDTLISAFSGL
jgi:hypothetical protein